MEDPTGKSILLKRQEVVPCVQLMLPVSESESMELKENISFRMRYTMQIDTWDIRMSTTEKEKPEFDRSRTIHRFHLETVATMKELNQRVAIFWLHSGQ